LMVMEERGRAYRRQRLADALREEIGTILEGELADPRIGLATVSELLLSPDGRSGQVFIHVDGDERAAEETLAALGAAKGFIRHELAERLRLRRAPELFFHLDGSQQYGTRIETLLGRIKKRK
jgi:ribosome-binding factor A